MMSRLPLDGPVSQTFPSFLMAVAVLRSVLEKAMAPHSSTLAWKIPWTEEPGGLQSMGSHRVRHDWSDLAAAAAAGNSTQSCPALCDPMDYTVHGILQARILEWVAFPFSRGFSPLRDRTQVSHIAGSLYCLSHQGNPRILEWEAFPFSSRSSQPRNRTGVSCIAGRFFNSWGREQYSREALGVLMRFFIAYFSTRICLLFRYTFFKFSFCCFFLF